MKKLSIVFIFPLLLCGCKDDPIVLDDFTYSNDNVVIKDTLSNVANEKAHIVFLYGQSNADGVSLNAYLEKGDRAKYEEYSNGYENVLINYVNDGYNTSSNSEFIKCTLGNGCAPDRFGPEIGIADKMAKKYPTEKTYIIKWTWGGTWLKDEWLDNHHGRGDLYNNSMDFSLKCLDYLLSKGYSLSLDGICWMQGENDSTIKDSDLYYGNTEAYVALLRHDLKKYQEEIRFVDAGINEEAGIWPHPVEINTAKKKFAKQSSLNFYIDPYELGLTSKNEPVGNVDFAHYDALSMVKLGQAFGEIVSKE